MEGKQGDNGDLRPIRFIVPDKQGKLQVQQEAVDFLNRLRHKIAVVAVTGKYRTGKSFLLNQLTRHSKGFGVGSTVEACTKGLWLWSE